MITVGSSTVFPIKPLQFGGPHDEARWPHMFPNLQKRHMLRMGRTGGILILIEVFFSFFSFLNQNPSTVPLLGLYPRELQTGASTEPRL